MQKTLNPRHISCVCYFKKFSLVSQHKASSLNQVTGALSQRYGLMAIISCEIIGLNLTPDFYAMDPFLSKVPHDVRNGKSQGYLIMNGFLFRGNWLYQPEGSVGLFEELLAGGFCGYFDQGKMKTLVKKIYYLRLYLKSNARFIQRCLRFKWTSEKSKIQVHIYSYRFLILIKSIFLWACS